MSRNRHLFFVLQKLFRYPLLCIQYSMKRMVSQDNIEGNSTSDMQICTCACVRFEYIRQILQVFHEYNGFKNWHGICDYKSGIEEHNH